MFTHTITIHVCVHVHVHTDMYVELLIVWVTGITAGKLSICGACYRPHLTTVYNTVVLSGDSIIATGAIQSTGRLYLEVLADQ